MLIEPPAFLDMRGVSYSFPAYPKVVNQVDWQIARGEVHSLVGRSGCGKTTLLKLASGLLLPDSGTVTVDGQALREPGSQLGFVFQAPTLLEWKTVTDNVLLPVALQRRPLAADHARAGELLALMGLAGLGRRFPTELSGGQQSRVAIARALLLAPSLLLLDEPFAALDAITREELQDDLLRICRLAQTTVFFVTHDISEAVYLADRVAVMAEGKITEDLAVDLPWPRQRELRYGAPFNAVCARVRQAMDGVLDMLSRVALGRMASLALFVAIVWAWETMARGSSLSALVLPAPSTIWEALWGGLRSGYFWPHLIHTATELLLGLTLGCAAGFLGGIVLGESAFLRRLLFPYVLVSQVVPKLALAPLFIVWFGFGMTSTVVITALICFFPLMENTLTGLQQVEPRKLELFRMLGATPAQTLLRLKIPSGLPVIMAGFRVAVVLALVGAVVGEFIGGSKGLGALIIASQGMMDTPLMFAVLLLITVLGLVMYQLAIALERLLLWPHLRIETTKDSA